MLQRTSDDRLAPLAVRAEIKRLNQIFLVYELPLQRSVASPEFSLSAHVSRGLLCPYQIHRNCYKSLHHVLKSTPHQWKIRFP